MHTSGPLLVSGFEAFAHHPSNPTAEAVRRLERERRLAARAAFVVLPVTWRGAARVLLARAAREGARGCLLFGLAARATTMRVERCAYNVMDARGADNAGVLRQAEAIVEGGAEVHRARGPLEEIHAALVGVGAPVDYSDDPGRFVCNATYYQVLAAGVPAVFVHVPPTRAVGGSVDDEALLGWMRAAVEGYLAALEK